MEDESKRDDTSGEMPGSELSTHVDSWEQLMDDFGIETTDKADDDSSAGDDKADNESSAGDDNHDSGLDGTNPDSEAANNSSDEDNHRAQLPDKFERKQIVDRGLFLKQPSVTFPTAISAVKERMPADRAEEINKELREIEWRNEYETIDAIEDRGELNEETRELALLLKQRGYEAGPMTPEEATAFYDFANDANEDIRDKKVQMIRDLLSKIRTGVRLERSWTPRQERFLDYIMSKVNMYERGDLKTEYPIDLRAMWLDKRELEDIYNYKHDHTEVGRISYEDIPYSEEELAKKMNIPVQDLDLDELLEYTDINDEKYIFAYGPYTYGDLYHIDGLRSIYARYDNIDELGDTQTRRSTAWVQVMDDRLLDTFTPIRAKSLDLHTKNGPKVKGRRIGTKHNVGAINEFRSGSPIGYNYAERGNIEDSLNNAFIAGEILMNLRLSPKNMIAVATSLGEKINSIAIDNNSDDQKAALKKLKNCCSRLSYYICSAINMNPSEAKEVYGKARPTSDAFYEEVKNRSENWTSQQDRYANKERASTFIKMNEWLLNTEAAYADLIATMTSSQDKQANSSGGAELGSQYSIEDGAIKEEVVAQNGEKINLADDKNQSFGKKVYNSQNLNNNGL